MPSHHRSKSLVDQSFSTGSPSTISTIVFRHFGFSYDSPSILNGRLVYNSTVPLIETSVTLMRDIGHELIGDHVFSRYGTPVDEELEAFINQLIGSQHV